MDLLISKFSSVWRGLNKEVCLSIKRWRLGSVADVFQVCYANSFQFAFHLGGALRFHSSNCLHVVSISGTSFSLLFSKLLFLDFEVDF